MELKDITRHKVIPFKLFEKVVGRLWHAAIGFPAGKGTALKNLMMSMHQGYLVQAAMSD